MTRGRKSEYTPALGDEICTWIADGGSLLAWCRKSGASYGTIMRYLSSNDEFRDNYARAREDQAHKLAEEIIEIADDGSGDTYVDENGVTRTNQEVVARSRLRVDARKWYAGKVAPKKYGDFQRTEIAGDPDNPLRMLAGQMTDEQLAAIASRK